MPGVGKWRFSVEVNEFIRAVETLGVDCYAGVPDSQLKALCDTLYDSYGVGDSHLVAANEGAAVGFAAGHYLATGKPALVYMQNSGIGNAVNPICSLINDRVYAIPVVFVIGWRGEPGVHDEPQHVFQGQITLDLLKVLDIMAFVITKETTYEEFTAMLNESKPVIAAGKSVAFVIKKGGLSTAVKPGYLNGYPLTREQIVSKIVSQAKEGDIFVSTTGKLSRELFEIREALKQSHKYDFLTVGSMGHSLMIAYAIARQKKERRICCLDGDGAVLMHTGSMAVVGAGKPENLIHVVINNEAHETVGGMPTVASKVNFVDLALASAYAVAYRAETEAELDDVLKTAYTARGPVFIEVKANLVSRADLGRPTTSPVENKDSFMSYLSAEKQ